MTVHTGLYHLLEVGLESHSEESILTQVEKVGIKWVVSLYLQGQMSEVMDMI